MLFALDPNKIVHPSSFQNSRKKDMVHSLLSSINGSSLFLPNPPQPSSSKSRHQNPAMIAAAARGDESSSSGECSRGKVVDENMIVLRKRIQEMKMVGSIKQAPEDWMEWEKSYYKHYDSDVCEAMGLLQTQLMKTRPGLALGLAALLTLSVSMSTFTGTLHLMEMIKWITSEIHFS